MEWVLVLGLVLAVVSAVARWRYPAVPKLIATTGLIGGLGMIAWSQMPMLLPVRAWFIIGTVALVAGIVDWATNAQT